MSLDLARMRSVNRLCNYLLIAVDPLRTLRLRPLGALPGGRRLFSLPQRDQVLSWYADAQFCLISIVKSDERLLQFAPAALI